MSAYCLTTFENFSPQLSLCVTVRSICNARGDSYSSETVEDDCRLQYFEALDLASEGKWQGL